MNDRAVLITPATMRLERLLPGPLERVWAYLTEADKRATWLCGGEFELRLGGRVQLEFDHAQLSREKATPARHKDAEHARFEGKITRLEPLRALAFSWTFGERPSEVLFELAPRGKEVLLTITHRGLDERTTRLSVMSGWDVHTGILADVLNGTEPRPFWSTHARLEKEYEASA
jgi:uncharacterized protein YndB with AHSA1/START domain